MKTERIDGTDHVIGSPDHAIARAAQQARLDQAYLDSHGADYERLCRALREWDALGCRADANATAFLGRELLFMRPMVERTIYDRLRAAEFVPVDTPIASAPPAREVAQARFRIGQALFRLQDLTLRFAPNHRLKVANHHRVGVRRHG